MEVGPPWPITDLLSVFYWNEGLLVLHHSLWVDLWKEAGWAGHFISCPMLQELFQFGRADQPRLQWSCVLGSQTNPPFFPPSRLFPQGFILSC